MDNHNKCNGHDMPYIQQNKSIDPIDKSSISDDEIYNCKMVGSNGRIKGKK